MKKDLNIALLGQGFGWGGGIDLLRNIANALLSLQDKHNLEVFLLLPVKNKLDSVAALRDLARQTVSKLVEQRKLQIPKPELAYDLTVRDYFTNTDGNLKILEYNERIGLIPVLKRIRADVVLPTFTPFDKTFPIPWVGYIYDFQHKYLADYFSVDECLSRDERFGSILRQNTAVIVNAKSVENDIYKFFPAHKCKVFTLPFSASPVKSWLASSAIDITERYKLPARYFVISNQFWVHKSHGTAFKALSMLVNENIVDDLHIVCTGKMEDHRFPDYIQGLQNEISELGVKERVHFLGHVPKKDQIEIMKKSLALIQPTLFEGGPGGGSVYDSISIGVPVIVSDIPVNQEIRQEGQVFYFEAGSAIDLASKMKTFLMQEREKPSKDELIESGNRRKRAMGERLLEAIRYARTMHKTDFQPE